MRIDSDMPLRMRAIVPITVNDVPLEPAFGRYAATIIDAMNAAADAWLRRGHRDHLRDVVRVRDSNDFQTGSDEIVLDRLVCNRCNDVHTFTITGAMP